ncbi:hypothetical protein FGB62_111g026 [Gracilaria domingensis]|nr:hypothetical protein FGB62_111g026 [Gracilaria domingensis]
MAPSAAAGTAQAFAPSQPLLPSVRPRSSVPPVSQRRAPHHDARLADARLADPPRACVSVNNEAAVKEAKKVYKAAKAEYKARKAEYKALKAKLEMEHKPVVTDMRPPPTVANPDKPQQKAGVTDMLMPPAVANPIPDDAVAVCQGKACCRMGADAVAMILGKQTLRAPCMKMCGGAGPSVKLAGRVVKVDVKKAVRDAVPTDARRSSPPKSPPSTIQANSVLELLGDPIPANII